MYIRKIPLVVLLLAPIVLVGDVRSTVHNIGDKTLIAPIYPMAHGYITTVVVMDAAGRSFRFNADGYTTEGVRVLGDATRCSVARNSVRTVIFEPDFSGPSIGNGWVRLTYSSNREFQATSHIHSYRDGELVFSTMSSAVKPSSDFRLYGVRWDGEETGISIVNPTSQAQTVAVRFHPGWLTPVTNQRPGSIERTWV